MKAWELLQKKGWCQFAFARNKKGAPIYPNMRASSYCALGAIQCIYKTQDKVDLAAEKLKTVTGFTDVSTWNDCEDQTKKKVIAALKRADV